MSAWRSRAPELVWVGPTAMAEVASCWAWCRAHLALRHRATLAELAARPVPGARRVLVVRLSREPQNGALWSQAAGAHPRARWAHLLGSLCEGESRTGEPWPGFERILWHRWRAGIPKWLAIGGPTGGGASWPAAPPASRSRPRQAIALCAARRDQAQALLDVLGAAGHHVHWSRPEALAAGTGWTAVLWDESAISQLGFDRWTQVTLLCSEGALPPRQAVLFTSPRTSDWHQLRSAGVAPVFSKPIDLPALSGWLDGSVAPVRR